MQLFTPVYNSLYQFTSVYTNLLQCASVYTSLHQSIPVKLVYSSIQKFTLVYNSKDQCILVNTCLLSASENFILVNHFGLYLNFEKLRTEIIAALYEIRS